MSRLQDYALELFQGRRRGLSDRAALAVLTALSSLYRAGLSGYLLPYAMGLRRQHRLPVPVLSIGNLTVGGTGKTPATQLVAHLLLARGHRPGIVSRGHGRAADAPTVAVVSDGARLLLSPPQAGDEPALLARTLRDVPVVVGKRRERAGRLALAQFSLDCLVLDDGLQYWQLHRDLDLALLDARAPFGPNGRVLPAGLLRVPRSHLARAGIVLITHADEVTADELAALRAEAARLAPRADLFTARHAPQALVGPDGEARPLDSLRGRPVLAFCGIARPDGFFETLRRQGARPVDCVSFEDHHSYSDCELAGLAAHGEGEWLLTTEKDLARIGEWPHARPLYALRIGLEVDDEGGFSAALERRLFCA